MYVNYGAVDVTSTGAVAVSGIKTLQVPGVAGIERYLQGSDNNALANKSVVYTPACHLRKSSPCTAATILAYPYSSGTNRIASPAA